MSEQAEVAGQTDFGDPEIDRALDLLGPGTHLRVLNERRDLLRFGGSRITYQHSEERLTVQVRQSRGGRQAWAVGGSLSADAVLALKDRLRQILRELDPVPSDSGGSGPGGPPPAVRRCYPATVAASADDRVAIFRQLRDVLGTDVELGGSAGHSVVHHAVADTEGLRRSETRTLASISVVAEAGEGISSFARALDRDAAALDPIGLARRVAGGLTERARAELTEGRRRRVLFGPQAAASLLACFAQLAFGADEMSGGASPLADPAVRLSPLLTLVDDGTDTAGLPTGFDAEGGTKRRVPLLTGGRPAGVVHDRRSAAEVGTTTTGHAVPMGWRFGAGPAVSHLRLQPGATGPADLLTVLDDGLWIQRVDYVRVLQPRQSLVTGTTRNATLLVAGGEVVARVPQFRFTVRLEELLRDVVAVGAGSERADTPFMESIVSPAMVVEGFPVTGLG